MPVLISLVVSQAPSLLQSHKVEELCLILWGGWSIGILGGVASAYQTHLNWKQGSFVRPTDVVGLELVFTAAMLVVCPRLRSQSLVALCCGMLGMSSVVVELGRSRVSHDALSPEKTAERAAAYRQGRKPAMALVAAVSLCRHTVLVDVATSFLTVLLCLSMSNLRSWAASSSSSSSSSSEASSAAEATDTETLADLPDFTACFMLAAAVAILAAFHFGMVRYDEMVSTSSTAQSLPAVATAATSDGTGGGGGSHRKRNHHSNPQPSHQQRQRQRKVSAKHKTKRSGGGDGVSSKDEFFPSEDLAATDGDVSSDASSDASSGQSSDDGDHPNREGKARVPPPSSAFTSSPRRSLNVIQGRWLALQAALSLACLYGGRFVCGSLFAAFYVQLPAYELLGATSYVGTSTYDQEKQIEDSRESAVVANVFLWATSLIGALLASNMVSRWSAGRRSHANDLALARLVLWSLLATASGPVFMLFTTNRLVAWAVLATYGGFNGFASVGALALYTRRLPVVQAVRVSFIKAAANGVGGLLPFTAAALWTAGFDPTSDGSASSYVPYSASSNRKSFMAVLSFSALLPACTLTLIILKQRKRDGGNGGGGGVGGGCGEGGGGGGGSATTNITGGVGGGDDDDDDYGGGGSGGGMNAEDLESFFMDYRLKQMREKLAEASKDIEAELEQGFDDNDSDEGPFGNGYRESNDDVDDDDASIFRESSSLIPAVTKKKSGGGSTGSGGGGGSFYQNNDKTTTPPPSSSSLSGAISL